MKNKSFVSYFKITMQLLIFLCAFVFASFTYAGTIYRCVDREGNEIISDYPLDGLTCKAVSEFTEMTSEEKEQIKKEKKKKIEKSEKERPLEECLESAEKRYKYNWDKTCKANKLTPSCNLSTTVSMRLDNNYMNDKNLCAQMYPSQKP